MLSFYEMNCLLEKQRAEQNNVLETAISPELKQKLLAMQAARSGKPAQMEPATPNTAPPAVASAPASPAPAAAPAPVAKPKNALPPELTGNASPNEPGSDDYTARFDKKFNSPGNIKPGIKPSSSKAQMNTASQTGAAERVAKNAERLMQFNNFLASPSYQGLTAMAIAELKMPYKVPEGRFEIAIDHTRGPSSNAAEELIMSRQDFLAIIKKVSSYVSSDKGEGNVSAGVTLRTKLSEQWGKPGTQGIVLRAMQFENRLMSPEIVNKVTTIENLAGLLARICDQPTRPVDEVAALKFLIKTANDVGYGHFFEISGDKIRIKSTAEASQVADGKEIGSKYDNVKSKFGEATEAQSTEWMNVMNLLEHWGM